MFVVVVVIVWFSFNLPEIHTKGIRKTEKDEICHRVLIIAKECVELTIQVVESLLS